VARAGTVMEKLVVLHPKLVAIAAIFIFTGLGKARIDSLITRLVGVIHCEGDFL
jgi:hypothetical protein